MFTKTSNPTSYRFERFITRPDGRRDYVDGDLCDLGRSTVEECAEYFSEFGYSRMDAGRSGGLNTIIRWLKVGADGTRCIWGVSFA